MPRLGLGLADYDNSQLQGKLAGGEPRGIVPYHAEAIYSDPLGAIRLKLSYRIDLLFNRIQGDSLTEVSRTPLRDAVPKPDPAARREKPCLMVGT